MKAYLKNIWHAAVTIIEGLSITASHLLRKPITIQYPDRTKRPVIDMLPERYRGLLDVDMKICTACTLCKQACPIGCIEIDIEKREVPGKPLQRFITRFDIDMGLCMFCGFCTEVCPTNAVHFTKRFEGSTENLGDLTFKFVMGEPVVPYKPSLKTKTPEDKT